MKLRISVATAFLLSLSVIPIVGALFWLRWGFYGPFLVVSTFPLWAALTAGVAVVLACFIRDD